MNARVVATVLVAEALCLGGCASSARMSVSPTSQPVEVVQQLTGQVVAAMDAIASLDARLESDVEAIANLDARVTAELAAVQVRVGQIGGGADSVTSWIYAVGAALVYPFLLRPARLTWQRWRTNGRNGDGQGCGGNGHAEN